MAKGLISIHLANELVTQFGQKVIQLEIGAGQKLSLRSVFERLRDEIDPWFAQFLTGEGVTATGIVQVIAKGRLIRVPDELDEEVESGSEIFLLPPIQGG